MLIQRIVTGALFVALVVGAIVWLPSLWAGLLLGAFWLIGVREWAVGFARLHLWGTIGYLLVFALLMFTVSPAMRATPIFNAVLVIALLWWLVALAAVLTYPRNISMATAAGAGFATLLPAWGLLAFLHSSGPRGPSLVLTMLVIVWATDIGAFLAGRAFGRLKLAPRVSPNKTWEGLLGGILCAAAVGWAASGILGIAALQSASLAVATAMASVIGDLTVSMFKRNVGLKDSGHLLPGHGGLLDRIDSLTSAVAVFVLGLAVAGITT